MCCDCSGLVRLCIIIKDDRFEIAVMVEVEVEMEVELNLAGSLADRVPYPSPQEE